MCRKMANIKAEAENYIEQKDFEGSSSDEEADIVADPNSPMSKMIHANMSCYQSRIRTDDGKYSYIQQQGKNPV